MSDAMRPPPPPISWEYETIRDVPKVLPIIIGTIGICLACIALVILLVPNGQ